MICLSRSGTVLTLFNETDITISPLLKLILN